MSNGTYPCPSREIDGEKGCERSFSTENGAVMHALNKTDDAHANVESKPDAYEVLSVETDETKSTEEVKTPSMPEAEEESTPEGEAECPECGAGLGMTEEEAAEALSSNTAEVNGEIRRGGFCSECGAFLAYEPEEVAA